MDEAAIWRRMAEKWREAAEQVAAPALRRCYVERAARYDRLAARVWEEGVANRWERITP